MSVDIELIYHETHGEICEYAGSQLGIYPDMFMTPQPCRQCNYCLLFPPPQRTGRIGILVPGLNKKINKIDWKKGF